MSIIELIQRLQEVARREPMAYVAIIVGDDPFERDIERIDLDTSNIHDPFVKLYCTEPCDSLAKLYSVIAAAEAGIKHFDVCVDIAEHDRGVSIDDFKDEREAVAKLKEALAALEEVRK
jgi:hypothetical protein